MMKLFIGLSAVVALSSSPALGQEMWKPSELGVGLDVYSGPQEGPCAIPTNDIAENNLIRALGEAGIDYAHTASKDYQRYAMISYDVNALENGQCSAVVDLRIIRLRYERLEEGGDDWSFLPVVYCTSVSVGRGNLYQSLGQAVMTTALERCLSRVKVSD